MTPSGPRVLVAGIGNLFFGDDGFGVEVARRLASEPFPAGVRLGEYGIRGVHLAHDLLDGYQAVVLVDATPMGAAPGTVAVLEVDPAALGADAATPAPMDGHAVSPATVLGLLAALGGTVDRALVVGCEPADIGAGIGLSPVVAEAVPAAVRAVLDVVEELCAI